MYEEAKKQAQIINKCFQEVFVEESDLMEKGGRFEERGTGGHRSERSEKYNRRQDVGYPLCPDGA